MKKGFIHSEETKEKIRAKRALQVVVHSEETRRKIGNANRGKPRPPELRARLSAALKGRKQTDEHIRKNREGHSGCKSVMWKGGISFEPYCVKFNNEFKERVRAFFDYCCVECGTPQTNVKLHIHHVNFNKQSCCDNTKPIFVALCHSCHSKTNYDREYWEQHFTEIINGYYEGRCYLQKGELGYMYHLKQKENKPLPTFGHAT